MISNENEDSSYQSAHFLTNLIVVAVIIYTAIRPIVHAFHQHFFIEPDSVGYMSLGSNIFHGKGYNDFAGYWCSDWPPFYPFVLGLCQKLLHCAPITSLGIVGGLCLAATLFTANLWLSKLTRSAAIRCAVVIALAFSVPLTNLANSGYSESLFVPLTVLCIYFLGCYLEKDSGVYFFLAIVAALLCCMTRYIGVTIVAAGAVAILLTPQLTIGKKLMHCVSFVILTMVPFLGWCLLNKKYSGTMMGERDPGSNSLHDCLTALYSCLGDSLVHPIFAVVLAAVSLISFVIWLLTQREEDFPFLRVAPLFILAYGFLIVYSSAKYNIDMIDDRLTSPLFVPLIAVSVGLLEYLRVAMVRWVSVVVTVCTCTFYLLTTAFAVTQPQIPDGGYLSSVWQRSNILAYVSKTTFNYPLDSNDSAATFLLGHKRADWVADDSDTPTMADVEADLNALDGPCYVIWLSNAIEPANFDPNEIVGKCSMSIVATFSDGVIFQKLGSAQAAAPTK